MPKMLLTGLLSALQLWTGLVGQSGDQHATLLQNVARVCEPESIDFRECPTQIAALEVAVAAEQQNATLARALGAALWRLSINGSNPDEMEQLRLRAIAEYDRAIQLAPADIETVFELAQLLSDINRIERLLTSVVVAAPQHPKAHGMLARVALARGQPSRAASELLAHVQLNQYEGEQDTRKHVLLGETLRQAGEVPRVAELYNLLIQKTSEGSRTELCRIFADVPLQGLEEYKDLLFRFRNITAACRP